MKVLLAGVFHESHGFTGDITGSEHFRVYRGEALAGRAGDGSQIAGFLSVAQRQRWSVVPAVAYEAMPSGVVDHAVFEAFWAELEAVLRAALDQGLDGIFLSLHGAMVTTREPDPEGELLRRIRAIPGAEKLPLFGVFDLHANLTPAMCSYADGLVCYRENPHVDAHDRAVHAAELLARCFQTGVRPRMRMRTAPIIWPPTGTATADAPMRMLEQSARKIEALVPGVLAVNVVGGYSFSDVYETGVGFSIVTEGSPIASDAALAKLMDEAWQLRSEGLPREHELDEVLRRPRRTNGPTVIAEPADNIGGGAPGDGTEVLRALLEHGVAGAGIVIADAQAVQVLQSIPLGTRARLAIGGKGSPLDAGPVTLEVELISRSDGRFTLEDRNSHLASAFGVNIDMGPSAVVRHRGLTVLLTSRKTPPFDLGQWRSQGIDPEKFNVIAVKAAVGHRRAYDPIAAESFTVRTRGPCASDPRLLPYRRVRRPVFPLDPLEAPP